METPPRPPSSEDIDPYAPPKAAQRDDNSVTFRRSHLYAALLPLTFVVGLATGFLFWGRDGQVGAPAAAAQAAVDPDVIQVPEATPEIRRYDVPIDDDPFLGPADAAITIIEFSDYECPYCQKWHAQVWPQIQAAYPNQVRLVYRDFPLEGLHMNAAPAAEAANCANDQGKFWEFHELLFSSDEGLNQAAYESHAEALGLEMARFKECVETRVYQDEVQADYQWAAQFGIRSTPTFFINGLAVVGSQPFEAFEAVIEKELAGEIP